MDQVCTEMLLIFQLLVKVRRGAKQSNTNYNRVGPLFKMFVVSPYNQRELCLHPGVAVVAATLVNKLHTRSVHDGFRGNKNAEDKHKGVGVAFEVGPNPTSVFSEVVHSGCVIAVDIARHDRVKS